MLAQISLLLLRASELGLLECIMSILNKLYWQRECEAATADKRHV